MSPTTTSLGVVPTVKFSNEGKVGLKGATVKLVALIAVFPATVTAIGPVVAAAGTLTVMLVDVLAVTVAVVPLKLTRLLAGVALKSVPVIMTVEPMGPEIGVKEVMVGTSTEPQTAPDGISPVIVHPFVPIKLVLAASALVPYCLPAAPSVPPLGVRGLALQPINVAE